MSHVRTIVYFYVQYISMRQYQKCVEPNLSTENDKWTHVGTLFLHRQRCKELRFFGLKGLQLMEKDGQHMNEGFV